MIESPQTDVCIVEEAQNETEKLLLADKPRDPEVLLITNPPITAKFYTAIRHLRSVAGPLARFRGLHIALFYHLLYSFFTSCFRSLVPYPIQPVAAILASLLLCRIHMAWTHAMIAMPSSKRWWQRMPPIKSSATKQLLLPTAIWALAQQLCIGIPGALLVAAHDTFRDPGVSGGDQEKVKKIAVFQCFGVVIIFFTIVIGILVPAEVSLKRVEASLLPEDDKAIVPFDKTFSGKLKPAALGGSGTLGMLNAWATFSKQSRIRLIKLYVKIFALQIAVAILFVMIFVGELKMIAGPDFQRLVDIAHKSFKGEL